MKTKVPQTGSLVELNQLISQFYMCYYIKRLIDLIRANCTSKFLPVSPAVAKISIPSSQPPLQDLDSGCPTRRCFLTSVLFA